MTVLEYRKKIFIKLTYSAFILSLMLFGLFAFSSVENTLKNLRLSYITKIYLPTWKFQLKNNLASYKSENNVLGRQVLNAQSVPVLLYHGIVEKPDGENVTIGAFREQMLALKNDGYETIKLSEFYEFMQGERVLPEKSFLLTFDDGRKDSYYPVDPILKSLNYEATIFVITKYSLGGSESNYYLSLNELKQMINNGRWDVQVHTKDGHDDSFKILPDGQKGHFYSNRLWIDDLNRPESREEYVQRVVTDLISAKDDLEMELGQNAIGFAYPFGDYGQSTINFPEAKSILPELVQHLYPLSFYQIWTGGGFSLNYPGEDQSLIKRIEVKPTWKSDDLLAVMNIVKDKDLPYSEGFRGYTGWVKAWGRMSLTNGSIALGSTSATHGGSNFLEGSYLWKNYIFMSDVILKKGQNFSLLARYKDGQNYVSCVFSPKFVRMEQSAEGEIKQIREERIDLVVTGKENTVSIEVKNDGVACFVDDSEVIRISSIYDIPEHGGVGLQTWDPHLNNSEIVVNDVLVEELNEKLAN